MFCHWKVHESNILISELSLWKKKKKEHILFFMYLTSFFFSSQRVTLKETLAERPPKEFRNDFWEI